jgi:electron-transferring-flavoprotein dehydrogenase
MKWNRSNATTLEVDVLFVGAGPASLAGAYHLRKLIDRYNARTRRRSRRDHDRRHREGARDRIAHHLRRGDGHGTIRGAAAGLERTRRAGRGRGRRGGGRLPDPQRRKFRLPIIPPPLRNHGKYVVSLNKLIRWFAPIVEAADVMLIPEFPGAELLYDEDDRVIGVRTGDKGIGRDGEPRDNFQPGADILAKVTVLGEGSRGSLAKKHIRRLGLDDGRNPQVYAVGVKEIWELPKGRVTPGFVMHTLGYPLPNNLFGGSFVYGMQNDLLDIGLVVGLDYADPFTDPHRLFNQFKQHPAIAACSRVDEMLHYGAKSLPEGGLLSQPKLLSVTAS